MLAHGNVSFYEARGDLQLIVDFVQPAGIGVWQAQFERLKEQLEAEGRSERQHHPQVFRPWGSYEGIDAGEGFQAKRLILSPGASISLQRHRHRAEHWVVVRGTAEVTRDDEVFTLEVNQSAYIPLGAVHRLRNPGSEPLHIIEVQSGDYLGEDDIERFEDIYGRDSKVS